MPSAANTRPGRFCRDGIVARVATIKWKKYRSGLAGGCQFGGLESSVARPICPLHCPSPETLLVIRTAFPPPIHHGKPRQGPRREHGRAGKDVHAAPRGS